MAWTSEISAKSAHSAKIGVALPYQNRSRQSDHAFSALLSQGQQLPTSVASSANSASLASRSATASTASSQAALLQMQEVSSPSSSSGSQAASMATTWVNAKADYERALNDLTIAVGANMTQEDAARMLGRSLTRIEKTSIKAGSASISQPYWQRVIAAKLLGGFNFRVAPDLPSWAPESAVEFRATSIQLAQYGLNGIGKSQLAKASSTTFGVTEPISSSVPEAPSEPVSTAASGTGPASLGATSQASNAATLAVTWVDTKTDYARALKELTTAVGANMTQDDAAELLGRPLTRIEKTSINAGSSETREPYWQRVVAARLLGAFNFRTAADLPSWAPNSASEFRKGAAELKQYGVNGLGTNQLEKAMAAFSS